MMLAHGTTEIHAEKIYSDGFFNPSTYFMCLRPDPKLAIYGTAGFCLRQNPKTKVYIDLYCHQDLLIRPFKKMLIHEANVWLAQKEETSSRGLIFIVDVSEEKVDYKKNVAQNVFIPTERVSITKINVSSIKKIITLSENLEYFRNVEYLRKDYNIKIEPLEDILPDKLSLRMYNTIFARWLRFFERDKIFKRHFSAGPPERNPQKHP